MWELNRFASVRIKFSVVVVVVVVVVASNTVRAECRQHLRRSAELLFQTYDWLNVSMGVSGSAWTQ